jgi:protein TonB
MRKESDSTGSTSSAPGSAQTPFDRCLVDGDPAAAASRRRSRRKALGVSLGIESALLAAVIFIPLMTTVAQPHLRDVMYIPFPLLAPRKANPGMKPAPPNHNPWNNHRGITYAEEEFKPGRPVRQDVNDSSDPAGSDGNGFPDVSGPGAPVFLDLKPANFAPPPPEETKKSSEKRPVKMSEPIVQAQLILRVEPRYPALAMQIHLQGTVVLHAIISREGRITSLEVLSGHPLFVPSALDAVRQWRYRPTILNGEPVEVETTITVIFQLQK